jgi:hypothetical protein
VNFFTRFDVQKPCCEIWHVMRHFVSRSKAGGCVLTMSPP